MRLLLDAHLSPAIAERLRRLHYFAIHDWRGEIQNREAEALVWLPLSDSHELDSYVDRLAVSEHMRLCVAEASVSEAGS